MPYEYDAETSQAIADLPQEQHDEATPVEGQQNTELADQKQPVGGDPNWNPSEWQLKFRDQTIVPKDRAHLVNLAQQGFSYSQRMQEVKQREAELNAQRQQYDQYAKLEDAFSKNPQFRDQIMQWYQQSLTPGVRPAQAAQASPEQSSIPPELLQEIQSLKEWKSQFEQYQQQQQEAAADQEIVNELEALKGKYARDDWEQESSNGATLAKEVLKHAYELGGVKLETAYRDLMWDSHTKNAEVSGMKKAAESQAASRKAGTVAGGRSKGAAPAAEMNPAGMEYRDIEARIKADFGINS
jgi:hypothetical protein